jgi:hypothetical protein
MIKGETKIYQLRKYKKNSSQLMLTRLTNILEYKIGITHGNKREKKSQNPRPNYLISNDEIEKKYIF